ncbi:MAG TPA: FtsQ-type POTRA domain-containing protein [Thermoanaerobaculia bacterium]
MTVYHGSSDRFFRPAELGTTPRNLRRLQARRLLVGLANLLLVVTLLLGGAWLWRKTQEDTRFAITTVEITGIVHAPRTAIEAIADGYEGANLFRLDLEGVRARLRRQPWIESVAVEKKLPDTLQIAITERKPAALVAAKDGLRYVDRSGVVFARLSPEVGDPDLPLIGETAPADIRAAVAFLETLRRERPDLYARVSQISASRSGGFAVWDRDLDSTVYVGPEGATKWTAVYQIAAAEGWGPGDLEYADVRFRERIVIKPKEAARSGAPR